VRVKTLGAFIFHKRHITGGGVWGGCGGVDWGANKCFMVYVVTHSGLTL
jgi:hypothetical protein